MNVPGGCGFTPGIKVIDPGKDALKDLIVYRGIGIVNRDQSRSLGGLDMLKTKITKVMGRDRDVDPTHVFEVSLPETFVECVKEYGQERADHLWRGALLIEARSAFVGLITEKTNTDAMSPTTAIKKMVDWKPKAAVGAKGDPDKAELKKLATDGSVESLEALQVKVAAMLAAKKG